MNAMQTYDRHDGVRGPGPCPVVTTARLVLRPHRMTDAEAIAASLGDYQVSKNLARVPAPYDRQDAQEWLSMVTSSLSEDWALAITTGDDVHIGTIGIELQQGEWHLGYWLNRYYWGRGYMSEAVHAAVGRFLMRMPGTVIHSGVFADNLASLKVQEKVGFRVSGVSEIHSLARGRPVAHVETRLELGDFLPAAPRR